jgi:hypothetical protein
MDDKISMEVEGERAHKNTNKGFRLLREIAK